MGEDHYQCVHCKVEYLEKPTTTINMFAFLKGKRYVLQIRPTHPFHPARIITNGRDAKDSKIVAINLSTIPNITPQNLKEKLKTLLIFS